MDLKHQLLSFQGVLLSADNVYTFPRINAKGGNEEKMKYVVDTILKFLKDEKYIESNVLSKDKIGIVRKFAMYIVMNADLPALEQMGDMEGIDQIIWTVSTIPKFLMCEMLWNSHFEMFISECIVFCNPKLSFDVATSFIEHLKYATPAESLEKLQLITIALYQLICRLHYFHFENDTLSHMLTMCTNEFKKCVNYFSDPPNAYKLNELPNDERFRHNGVCFRAMLNTVCKCIQLFNLKHEFTPPDDLYYLTYLGGFYSNEPLDFKMCDSPNQAILACLKTCNLALLDKCKELAMEVTVVIFCSWQEFEINGMNMQQVIGETCYKVDKELEATPEAAEHPVRNMIRQISRRPPNINDIINTTESNQIIANIQNCDDKESWIQALLNKEGLCNDVALVENLSSNLNILDEAGCRKVYGICESYLREHSENKGPVELLAVQAFQNCSDETKFEKLDERFTNNSFRDMTENEKFIPIMTKIFNKLIDSPDASVSDILTAFLYNPQKAYTAILELAAQNNQQSDIMLKAMKLLEKYKNYCYDKETEPCLIKVVKRILEIELDTEGKQDTFIKFLKNLKDMRIIPSSTLLILVVMPNLHQALIKKDIKSINTHCKLLSQAYEISDLLEFRAPMLAMLAQIMEAVRWEIHTFLPLAPNTLHEALQLQEALFKSYENGIPERESIWLKGQLKKMKPLNQYYFIGLWSPQKKTIVEVAMGEKVDENLDMVKLQCWLPVVLCSTTSREWSYIWECLDVFGDDQILEMYQKAMTMVALTEKARRTEKTWGCLLNCYKNFVLNIRYKYFRHPMTENQVLAVMRALNSVSKIATKDNIEEFRTILMPLLSYIAENRNEYDVMTTFNTICRVGM